MCREKCKNGREIFFCRAAQARSSHPGWALIAGNAPEGNTPRPRPRARPRARPPGRFPPPRRPLPPPAPPSPAPPFPVSRAGRLPGPAVPTHTPEGLPGGAGRWCAPAGREAEAPGQLSGGQRTGGRRTGCFGSEAAATGPPAHRFPTMRQRRLPMRRQAECLVI